MSEDGHIKSQMTPKEIIELNKIFDESVTDWIQEYMGIKDKYHKEAIIEKTEIIAKYRNDKGLVERIKQRMGLM